jgi:hypothetical protein
VQTKAYEEVGGWDTSIPFYMTDCDVHERLFMRGFKITDADAGYVVDTGSGLDDLEVLYRKKSADGQVRQASFVNPYADPETENQRQPEHRDGHMVKRESVLKYNITGLPLESRFLEEDTMNSTAFTNLLELAKQMQDAKGSAKEGRNTCQSRQRGGEGKPYYRDPLGFEESLQMLMNVGRRSMLRSGITEIAISLMPVYWIKKTPGRYSMIGIEKRRHRTG